MGGLEMWGGGIRNAGWGDEERKKGSEIHGGGGVWQGVRNGLGGNLAVKDVGQRACGELRGQKHTAKGLLRGSTWGSHQCSTAL